MRFWKTTVEIWTDYDPSTVELEDLAREATRGDAICTASMSEEVTDLEQVPEAVLSFNWVELDEDTDEEDDWTRDYSTERDHESYTVADED
jgi:hypothetical protein